MRLQWLPGCPQKQEAALIFPTLLESQSDPDCYPFLAGCVRAQDQICRGCLCSDGSPATETTGMQCQESLPEVKGTKKPLPCVFGHLREAVLPVIMASTHWTPPKASTGTLDPQYFYLKAITVTPS